MFDNLYGNWGLAELVALLQKYPWSCFAVAVVAGLIVYESLRPKRGGDDAGALFWGDGDFGGDIGSCGE